MNEGLKRALLIFGFVAVTVGIGTGLYFAFFRRVVEAPEALPPAGEAPVGGLPSAGVGGPTAAAPFVPVAPPKLGQAASVAGGGVTQNVALTSSPVRAATATAGGGANYYDPADGRFYALDRDGNRVALSPQQFPNVSDVAWNAGADKAVVEFPDGSNVVFDFATQTQVTLPAHWEDFSFSPVKDEIVAKSIGLDPNNRYLVVSNADGSNVKSVQPLGFNASKVDIAPSPNDQVLAFADTAGGLAGGLDRKMVFPIGRNQENFKGLVIEGNDFIPEWSPDGSRLLYSAVGDFSDNKPTLWIVDATAATMGDNRRAIGLDTWADKCAFQSGTTLYCAVPVTLPENAGLQRALSDATPDRLYRVDLVSGAVSLTAVPETDARMTDLSVSGDGSAVFFTNAFTGRLESIRLK